MQNADISLNISHNDLLQELIFNITIQEVEVNEAPVFSIQPQSNANIGPISLAGYFTHIVPFDENSTYLEKYINGNDAQTGIVVTANDPNEGDISHLVNYFSPLVVGEWNSLSAGNSFFISVEVQDSDGLFGTAQEGSYLGWAVQVEQDTATEGTQVLGDANLDGVVNVLDVVLTVNAVIENIIFTNEQISAADMTNDGNINVLDVVTMVNFILDN